MKITKDCIGYPQGPADITEYMFMTTFFKTLEERGSFYTHRKVKIVLVDHPEEIGYTGFGKDGAVKIALNYNHEYFDGLSKEEKLIYITGIFIHETLHQILTPFLFFNRATLMHKREAMIFHNIANTMEDPYIEATAKYIVGKEDLECLRYAIRENYNHTPRLGENTLNPFTEWILAMIQFGDVGPLKGTFLSEDAKKVFIETAPVVYDCTKEIFPSKRLKLIEGVFEMTRPLWMLDMDESEIEKLSKALRKLGKTSSHSSERNDSCIPTKRMVEEGEDSGESSKEERRTKIAKMLEDKEKKSSKKSGSSEREENEEESSESASGTPKEESDSESGQSGDESKSSGSESEEEGSENGEGDSSGSGEGKSDSEGEDLDSEDDSFGKGGSLSGLDGDFEESDGDSEDDSLDGTMSGSDGGEDSDDCEEAELSVNPSSAGSPSGAMIPEIEDRSSEYTPGTETEVGEGTEEESHYEISKEVLDAFERSIDGITYTVEKQEEERMKEVEMRKISKHRVESTMPKIESPLYARPIDCVNYFPETGSYAGYEIIREAMGEIISVSTKKWKKLMFPPEESKRYSKSGKFNWKRYNSAKVTPRIYTKKKTPNDKNDWCLMVQVDESGSMYGYKARCARDTAIVIAEVCSKLDIPVYIFGFTTTDGYREKVAHYHYVRWDNTYEERIALQNIQGRNNNMDSFSVRYASQILKKRTEAHRVHLILSDGAPSADGFAPGMGVLDTANAIQSARQISDVIGIGIGNGCDPYTFDKLYGGRSGWIQVLDPSDVANIVMFALQEVIKSW